MAKQAKLTSNAVSVAASNAGKIATRFQAVESAAQRAHEEMTGGRLVRALLQGGKLHAVVTDGQSTIEVCNGAVALSVAQPETEE
jgi:hypothetical protein